MDNSVFQVFKSRADAVEQTTKELDEKKVELRRAKQQANMQKAMRNKLLQKIDKDDKAKLQEILDQVKDGNLLDTMSEIKELQKSRALKKTLEENTDTNLNRLEEEVDKKTAVVEDLRASVERDKDIRKEIKDRKRQLLQQRGEKPLKYTVYKPNGTKEDKFSFYDEAEGLLGTVQTVVESTIKCA